MSAVTTLKLCKRKGKEEKRQALHEVTKPLPSPEAGSVPGALASGLPLAWQMAKAARFSPPNSMFLCFFY